MKKSHSSVSILSILLLLIIIAFPLSTSAAEFDAMVVPSLMDSGMDGWYKIPPNSGPNIHKASSIYKDQFFNLLIFISGYSADEKKNLYVTYDVQVFDPKGRPTDDKGTDLLAYRGPMGSPDAIILNQQYLKIVFTDKYPIGTYNIKVTAHDKISGSTSTSEAPINLLSFSMPEKFDTDEEVAKWLMGYYANPTPIKAISGVQKMVETDRKWLDENLNVLTFFRQIFADNPFLLKNIAKNFGFLSFEDKKKFLLIAGIAGDNSLEPLLPPSGSDELQQVYNQAKDINLPDVSGQIKSAVQLDILWSEFLTTGKY
jgi:hypothetical protein